MLTSKSRRTSNRASGQSIDALGARDIASCLNACARGGIPAQELAGVSAETAHPAAVLIPLFRLHERWRLLYIRRSEYDGDHHSGEVAFPGGRSQTGDESCAATALREAWEEIGLPSQEVELLGELPPFLTVSNYLVTPIVGLVPWPLELRPDPTEVARVFSMPLAWLEDPANRRVRAWPSPDHPQVRQVVFFDEHDGELLWGVSARITLDFLACLREAALGQGA